jgi:hypothetical protein
LREAEAFRFVFEQVLKSCIDAGLVGSEGFAVDASRVKPESHGQEIAGLIRDFLNRKVDSSPLAAN